MSGPQRVDVKVNLSEVEYEAVGRIASDDCRSYPEVLHYALRKMLIERGYLVPVTVKPIKEGE